MEDKNIRMARAVAEAAAREGGRCYYVGGCVRDSLLGKQPHDWDITTSALPLQVKALFSRTIDTGLKHGTVTIPSGREAYEVTTYRIDGEYLDGRHPSEVTFTASLREDLKRRDFTINKKICCVGDASERFREDALRILRAVRFSAQLGYTVEEGTLRAMRTLAPTLARISAERIAAELEKILVSPHPDRLRMAYECGITAVILPEFDRCMETPQNNPHHIYNVGEHTMCALMQARPDRILRTAILLHDVGKPLCRSTDEKGIDHFYGHPEAGAKIAEEILRRLKSDNETRRKTVQLVRCHDREIRLTPAGVRQAIVRIGEDLFPLLLEVKEADMLAQSTFRREEKKAHIGRVRELYAEILEHKDCLTLRDLAVNGNDLIKYGVRPGKEMGRILHEMLEDVLAEPSHNDREYLLQKWSIVTGRS